jgi:hypothetical protein
MRAEPISILPQGLRPNQAAAYVGSSKLLEEMIEADWIQPIVSRHKLTLFARRDLDQAFDRLLTGEVPTIAAHA